MANEAQIKAQIANISNPKLNQELRSTSMSKKKKTVS
jgi:hypothetical protein